MIRNLDTNLLRSFVAVADSGSVTAAADRLNLTQGAVSQRIKRLEETLQTKLFDRRHRTLVLTNRGEYLVGPSKRMLALNDDIWNEMTEPAISGEVRLGLPHDLVATYLPVALDGFAAENPFIEISLVTASSTELRADVEAGRVDIALAEEPVGVGSGECLGTDPLVWVGAKHGRAHAKRPLPLSMISAGCAFRPLIGEALKGEGITWRSVFENSTMDATLTTVRADLAITVSLSSVVPEDLEILADGFDLPRLPDYAINLYVGDGGKNPAVQQLSLHLRNKLRLRRI